jgi:NAD+ synthase (glutamine-hydrolysing)
MTCPVSYPLSVSETAYFQLARSVADQCTAFGRLRKEEKLGPWSMYLRLLGEWKEQTPTAVGDMVMKFFRFYSMNRHKAVVLTPSVHL